MHVIATLGDAPTAAIAVVAILLGLLFAARGPRDKRGAEAQTGPTFVSLPVATAPDAEPGFVGPEGTIVGHGPIRLGSPSTLGGAEAAPSADVPAWAAPPPAPADAPAEPVVEAEPAAPAEPAESGEAEAAFPGQPEAAGTEVTEPASAATEAAEPAAVKPESAESESAESDGAESEGAGSAGSEPGPASAEPEPSTEPAWRRYMHKPSVPFRHGGVKLGGKPVGTPPED